MRRPRPTTAATTKRSRRKTHVRDVARNDHLAEPDPGVGIDLIAALATT
jgi:hypothetical protein